MKRLDRITAWLVAIPFVLLFAAAFYAAFFWQR